VPWSRAAWWWWRRARKNRGGRQRAGGQQPRPCVYGYVSCRDVRAAVRPLSRCSLARARCRGRADSRRRHSQLVGVGAPAQAVVWRASNRRSSVIVSRQLLASDCGCPTVRRRLMRFGVGDEHAGADGFVVLRVSTCADAGVLGARGVDKADVRVLPSRAPVHRRLLAFQLPNLDRPRAAPRPQGDSTQRRPLPHVQVHSTLLSSLSGLPS